MFLPKSLLQTAVQHIRQCHSGAVLPVYAVLVSLSAMSEQLPFPHLLLLMGSETACATALIFQFCQRLES